MSIAESNLSHSPADLRYLATINQFPKFGPIRLRKIKNHFSSFETAYSSTQQEFTKAGIEEKIVEEFFEFKKSIDTETILNDLIKEGISIVSVDDEDYPPLLLEISNPPILLYYKGSLKGYSQNCISIVGSRRFTIYGKQVTEKLAKELSENNINIISGLAAGIDTVAHTTCMNNNGKTFAVLGTGVERKGIYPAMNKYLADEIVANGGAILSEFPIGTPPLRYNFPQRNRIISGMSHGTLIVEAAKKSGALITAKYALEQNREVFAVPGNIYSHTSEGPNNLIKEGAVPVTCIDDLLRTFNIAAKIKQTIIKKTIPATPDEEDILKHLSQNPMHIDELTFLTKKSVSEISSALTIMELRGQVINTGAMQYIAVSDH